MSMINYGVKLFFYLFMFYSHENETVKLANKSKKPLGGDGGGKNKKKGGEGGGGGGESLKKVP